MNNLIAESAVIEKGVEIGRNVTIGEKTIIKSGTKICDGCIIGDECIIGENSYVDFNVIIRNQVSLGKNAFVGARSILGEYLVDFIAERSLKAHPLVIGDDAVIRSETILYGDSEMGDGFQTGHRVTIREKSKLGKHVRVGTLSDIQG